MSGEPDPKPAKRVRDSKARERAKLLRPWCEACGLGLGELGAQGLGLDAHHVLFRGQGGDDVQGNLFNLCGSGTTGCHGLVHAAHRETRELIGRKIVARRPDVVAYLTDKLGKEGANDFLRRVYFAELPDEQQPAPARRFVSHRPEHMSSHSERIA